jgi:hypothetical protein
MLRPAAALIAAALCAPFPASAQAPAADPEAGGFRVTVVQPPRGVDAGAFERAVVAALPARLLDPDANFMRDPVARADAPYRMVLVFHGSADPPPADICVERGAAADVVPRPPRPGAVGTDPTGLAAAFCRRTETLSAAASRISGGLDPEQASFRFLVADVVQQLFPLGFEILPRPAGR